MRKHFLRFALLLVITLAEHFVEDVACAVVVAHVDVGLGQIEFGGGFVGHGEEVEVLVVQITAPTNWMWPGDTWKWGKNNGRRVILNEGLREGDDKKKSEAKEMLSHLA